MAPGPIGARARLPPWPDVVAASPRARGLVTRPGNHGSRNDHDDAARDRNDNLRRAPYGFPDGQGPAHRSNAATAGEAVHGGSADLAGRESAVRRHQGAAGGELRRRAGPDLRARRAQRRGQDLAVQLHQRALQADRGHRADRQHRGAGRASGDARPARPGPDVPAPRAAAARDGARERAARRAHPAPRRSAGVVGADCRAPGARRRSCAPRRSTCWSATAWGGRRTCRPTSCRTASTRASSSAARCS